MYKYWVEYQTIKVLWNDMEYIAKVKVKWYNDPDYGADADGNRGFSRDFIEGITIEEVLDIFGTLIDPIPEFLEEEINKSIE